VVVTDLWETPRTPADNRGNEDSIDRPFRLPPPKTGSVLRVIEYPPDKERVPALAQERDARPTAQAGTKRWTVAIRVIRASTGPIRSIMRSCCPARSWR